MEKKYKIALLAVSFLLIFILGMGIFLSFHFEKIIRSGLNVAMKESTHGLYRLQYEKMNFNFFSGNLRIKEISFTPDPLVLDSLRKHAGTPEAVYDIRAKELRVSFGILKKILKDRNLIVKKVDLYTPRIMITRDSAGKKPLHEEKDLPGIFRQFFSKFEVKKLRIHDGTFKQQDARLEDPLLFSVEHCDLQIDRFTLDSTVDFRNKKYPQWENVQCRIKEIGYNFPSKEYKIHLQGLTLNYKDSLLKVDSFALIPRYGKYEFARKSTNRFDRFEVYTQDVVFSGVRFHDFLVNEELYIDSISVGNLSFADYKNMHFPLVRRERGLFHLAIHRVPFKFTVPKIEVKKGGVLFEMIAVHHDQAGSIRFENLHGLFTGLTNTPSEKEQYLTADAKCKLNGAGALNMKFSFPLTIENETVTIIGNLGYMDMTSLNTMIYPASTARIKTGVSDRMHFVIRAKNEVAHIDFTFLYHDLKIELPPMKHQKLVTGIVNTIFLLRDNPPKGSEPRSVRTYVYRDHYRDNFYYWWQAIFAGLKETEGITKTIEKRVKEIQANRKEKREKREKRKQENQANKK